ncbi:T9SS type A sorting domain-containing protein [Flavobacterium ginsengiterrae]|uniref:T9SS type A sorting domain-containing protein n=1 Tax=Flavobacterium ginsengiterrae TaxID=871695 RepID=UPI0031E57D0A
MKRTLLCLFLLFNIHFSFSQWVNLDTGLTDNLTGVVFFGNNGLVSGEKGLYFTTNGGQGAESWQQFKIIDNAGNAIIYDNTKFTHCYAEDSGSASTGIVFACGQNTLTSQAIIMKIELPALKYEILYVGAINSKLNNISYSRINGEYVAVGNNGLVVTFNASKIKDAVKLSDDDFTSISFYNSKCKIAANGKLFYFEYFDNKYNFQEMKTPNSTNNAVAYGTGLYNNGRSYAVGDRFLHFNIYNELYNNHTNYYNGVLNAKCISANSDSEYIGTDHGIYYNYGNNVLEWQTTSLNYSINSFWKQVANAAIYACGNSGVILKTVNGGGERVPYVNISSLTGVCVGDNLKLDGIRGATSSCKWFVNDVQVSTVCGSVFYSFKTAGNYDIKYIVKNSYGIESTDTKKIYISPIPIINLPVKISDNILCKSESIDVEIQNSEVGVVYTLRRNGDAGSYGTSGPGNGHTISFKSNLISKTGDYYLQAKNGDAACYKEFNDRIHITVEHTQADFYADIINANPDEKVTFYEKAIDAQNYKWDFLPNASLLTSGLAQDKTSFSKEGNTKIDLEVWSDNGCYDKIEKDGPYIYKDSETSNNCWALINDGVDSQWNGYEYEGNYGLTSTEDGFLVSGGFNDQIFDSKIGVKPNFRNKIGSFLTKYDRKGVLKWMLSTEHALTNRDRDIIFSSVVDHDGNIYICGTHDGTFIDNKGERIKVSVVTGANVNYGYIMKLDKQGKLIWILNSETSGPLAKKLYIDNDNNLITTINLNSAYTNQYQLYFNGVKSTMINQPMETTQADNLTLLKISPLGNVIWYAGITLYHVNSAGIESLGIDKDNNIYFGGNYEFDLKLYSAGNNAAPQVLKRFAGYGQRMFLVKYNKDGILQWKTRSSTENNEIKNNVTFGSMVTDKEGNNYITGSNNCTNANAMHVFENADGSITQNNIGSFFLTKVNSAGKCEWITGSKYANSGGNKIIKDNNKLHIIGGISETGDFIIGNGQSYKLTMSNYDFFMATYDLSGNLKKITANGDNRNHINVPLINIYDFFKAEDGSFYLCANMRANNYTSFGSVITTNEIDGTVIHFNEDCGIVKYESTLSTDDFVKTSNAVVYPNPTSGKISVDLKSYTGGGTIQLYDTNGTKLTEKVFSDSSKTDLMINGSTGVYFVKIKADEKTQTFKVLKQ